MRTARLLPVSPSMHRAGADGLLAGGTWSPGGACLWSGGRVYPSMQWGRSAPCEQNHRHVLKYNLAPMCLRAVITTFSFFLIKRRKNAELTQSKIIHFALCFAIVVFFQHNRVYNVYIYLLPIRVPEEQVFCSDILRARSHLTTTTI